MSETKIKILFVEDDENLGFVTKDNLEIKNFQVHWEKNGALGFEAFCKHEFDLCVLDVMLPVMDGFTLAKEIRAINTHIPILFLTAKSLDSDKIEGFKTGADDYVTKPFNIELLELRIRALHKRSLPFSESTEVNYEIGKCKFDYSSQVLLIGDTLEKLSHKEAELLKLLCINKNKVLPREVALQIIWGENDYFKGRSMDVFIARLRKVLKADDSVKINTVHGKGFQLIDIN